MEGDDTSFQDNVYFTGQTSLLVSHDCNVSCYMHVMPLSHFLKLDGNAFFVVVVVVVVVLLSFELHAILTYLCFCLLVIRGQPFVDVFYSLHNLLMGRTHTFFYILPVSIFEFHTSEQIRRKTTK